MSTTKTVHIMIHGRVQGVGFRYWLAGEAQDRGLIGWVRNCRDGAVEAVFCGEDGVIKDMLMVCSVGPRFARVSRLETLDETEFAGDSFEIRPTI